MMEKEMKTVDINAIIEENKVLMQQIKENREKFWNNQEQAPVRKKANK